MAFGKILAAGAALAIYQLLKDDKPGSARDATLGRRAHEKKAVYTDQVVKGQIRLLERVLRLIRDDTPSLSWRFDHVCLKDRPTYDALSYTWSDTPEDHSINIGSHDFPLTKDLLNFLTRYDDVSTAPIWVDAICIQQADHDEKAEQVSQMTQVYENARRVIVWLGDSFDDSSEAFELLTSFGSPSNEEDFSRAAVSSFRSTSDTHKWMALANLLSRRWWTRAWIFQVRTMYLALDDLADHRARRQEVVAAKKAEVWCGADSCPWDHFAALSIVIEDNLSFFLHHTMNDVSTKLMANHHLVLNLAIYQRQHKAFCPPSLSEALQTRRQANASDLRDKVYSLLGICREEQDLPLSLRGGMIFNGQSQPPQGPNLKICYDDSYSVADVYKDVAHHIITKCRHLEILSACQNPKQNLHIPSWAPDWSVRRRTNPIVAPDIWGRIYCASTEEAPFKFEPGSDSDEVVVRGIYVGTIKALGPVRLPSDAWQDGAMSWARIAVQCSTAHPDGTPLRPDEPNPNDGHSLYHTGETIEGAFLRTCVMDRIEEFRVAPGVHLNPHEVKGELSKRETIARDDATYNRRFASLDTRFMGLFPAEAQLNDDVFIFAGADVPFTVHSSLFRGKVLVGECYVHGLMYGEVAGIMEQSRQADNDIDWSDIKLR